MRKKKPPDPKKVDNRVWERKISLWDPRGEIMSTNEVLFCGFAGLEGKNGTTRPEKGGNPGLREEKTAVRPEMRNYVNI